MYAQTSQTGQPAADTIASQDCVRTDTNGKWDDLGCTQLKNYACQIPAGNAGKKSSTLLL